MRSMSRSRQSFLAVVLATAVCAGAAAPSLAQDVALREEGGLRYFCGGVGDEEREALRALRAQANMELLLVTGKRGAYVAGVSLRFSRSGSGAPGVQIQAEGPICLLSLPPGTYRVEATYEGTTRTRNVSTASAGAKPAVIAFPDSSD